MQNVCVRTALGALFITTTVIQGCTAGINQEAKPEMSVASASLSSGFVTDSAMGMVKSANDTCVRTISWDQDSADGECDVVLVPAVATAPVSTAVSRALVSYNGRALFDFDSSTLSVEGRGQLDGLTAKLNAQDTIKEIEIVGHADSIGSDTYNQKLSENRATAVQEYLQPSLRTVSVTAKGVGESAPIANNNTEAGRRLNRRVDVNIAAVISQ